MCDALDENEDLPTNVDPDGWEEWEPEFDEDGSATNVGQNVRDPFKERLARDE